VLGQIAQLAGQTCDRPAVGVHADSEIPISQVAKQLRERPEPGFVRLDVDSDDDRLGFESANRARRATKRIDLVVGQVGQEVDLDRLGFESANRARRVAQVLDLRVRYGAGEVDADRLGFESANRARGVADLLDLRVGDVRVERGLDVDSGVPAEFAKLRLESPLVQLYADLDVESAAPTDLPQLRLEVELVQVDLRLDAEVRCPQRRLRGAQGGGGVDFDGDVQRVAIELLLHRGERRGQGSIEFCRDTAGVDLDAEVDLSDR